MKRLLVGLCVTMIAVGMAGTVSAIPYTDTYDAGQAYMQGSLFGSDDSVSWTFDITDDGFNPATQDVTAASVEISLQDESDNFPWIEYASLEVGTNSFFWEVDTGDLSFNITSLMSLSETGTVDATLTATWGDFYFKSATLYAEGTEHIVNPESTEHIATPVATPEPGTIALLGIGLAGLVGVGVRRRMKKKKD